MLSKKRTQFLLLLLVPVIAVCWRTGAAYRQLTLNRALVVAVDEKDLAAVTTLLKQGADPNTKDRRHSESLDWLQTVRSLFTHKLNDGNPEPVLAIAMNHSNGAIAQRLQEYGADPDLVTLWRMKFVIPDEEEAIINGIHLRHALVRPSQPESSDPIKSWIGKRVTFDGMEKNSNTVIADGITVRIEFVPSRPVWPIVIEACLVGTVKSIDVKHKLIYIRVDPQDYHIEATG